jgi:hypothetical protein
LIRLGVSAGQRGTEQKQIQGLIMDHIGKGSAKKKQIESIMIYIIFPYSHDLPNRISAGRCQTFTV